MGTVLKRGSFIKIYEKICDFIKFFLCNFEVSSGISLSFQRFDFTDDVCDRNPTDSKLEGQEKLFEMLFFGNLKWTSWYTNEWSFAMPIYQSSSYIHV